MCSVALPTRACFYGSWKEIIRYSVYLTVKMPLYFLVKCIIYALPVWLTAAAVSWKLTWAPPVLFLFAVPGCSWLACRMYWKGLKQTGLVKEKKET